VTTEPPRRLRPSGAARAKTILTQTRGAQSAQGSTGSARPVADRPRSRDYQPAASSGVVVGDTTGQDEAIAITSTFGAGSGSTASADNAIAIGSGSLASGVEAIAIGNVADADGQDAVCVGVGSATADYSICIGTAAATAANAIAIGKDVHATAAGAVAIGCDSTGVAASSSHTDEIVLGTASHNVVVFGGIVLMDSGGNQWRITVDTGGNLVTTAYP
jgi:hypothetical protein